MERLEALEPRISQRIKAADPKSLVEKSSSGNREIVGIRFLIFSQKQFDTQVKKSRFYFLVFPAIHFIREILLPVLGPHLTILAFPTAAPLRILRRVSHDFDAGSILLVETGIDEADHRAEGFCLEPSFGQGRR